MSKSGGLLRLIQEALKYKISSIGQMAVMQNNNTNTVMRYRDQHAESP
jgi:hypothetical protein